MHYQDTSRTPIEIRILRGLALLLPLLGSAATAFAGVAGAPPPPAVAITALRAAGADLAVDLVLRPGAPAKLVVVLETATGQPQGSVIHSPAREGRMTVMLAGAVESFLTDGFDYRLLLRDGNGAEVAKPAPFTVGMSCAGEVCRFVPELGVDRGAAVWLEDRLAAALRDGDPATPDLLGEAVAEDSRLAGAARNLSARLAAEADGMCHCRWAYSTTPATCGNPGATIGIYDRGVAQPGLSVHQVWQGGMRVETFCWTARSGDSEKIRIAFGDREVAVAWPRVQLAPCGSCAGLAVTNATFLGGAYAVAEGTSGVTTRASWEYLVAADGNAALSAADVRTAYSPLGDERHESMRTWTGLAGAIDWRVEMQADLEAPRGVDWGVAAAQVVYDIRSTAEAACASPPHVEVARIGGGHSLENLFNPFDPNQISVVIGECRPPR